MYYYFVCCNTNKPHPHSILVIISVFHIEEESSILSGGGLIINIIHRSTWKFFYFSPQIVKMALIYNYITIKKTGKPSKFWKKRYLMFKTKNFCIPKFLRNSNFWVHQGKHFVKRQVYPFMLGHKVGEFCLTKKPFFYPPKKKKR